MGRDNAMQKEMHNFMQRALDLASQSSPLAAPNPRVGCVIVRDGEILGEGMTQAAGGSHAEIVAMLDAESKGHDIRGATVYTTLEPCAHFGKTPPCVEALIRARVAKVVAAIKDPDPRVSGKGFERLKAAGIEVVEGIMPEKAREMNLGFLSRMERGRPWVRMKLAVSLDGKTALHNGESQWITSPQAREDGHRWRARACGILTGIGTVQKDNPQLSVRDSEVLRQPQRMVVDSNLHINPNAQILEGGGTWVLTTLPNTAGSAKALQEKGAEIITLPSQRGRVDLHAVMRELAKRSMNEIHVEAGEVLNGALIQENLVDELLVYIAPNLLGEGKGMFALPAIRHLKDKKTLEFREMTKIGEDLRILARYNRHLYIRNI